MNCDSLTLKTLEGRNLKNSFGEQNIEIWVKYKNMVSLGNNKEFILYALPLLKSDSLQSYRVFSDLPVFYFQNQIIKNGEIQYQMGGIYKLGKKDNYDKGFLGMYPKSFLNKFDVYKFQNNNIKYSFCKEIGFLDLEYYNVHKPDSFQDYFVYNGILICVKENICYYYYDPPCFIKRMLSFHLQFYLKEFGVALNQEYEIDKETIEFGKKMLECGYKKEEVIKLIRLDENEFKMLLKN